MRKQHHSTRQNLDGLWFCFLGASIAPFMVNSFFTNQLSKTLAIPLPIN